MGIFAKVRGENKNKNETNHLVWCVNAEFMQVALLHLNISEQCCIIACLHPLLGCPTSFFAIDRQPQVPHLSALHAVETLDQVDQWTPWEGNKYDHQVGTFSKREIAIDSAFQKTCPQQKKNSKVVRKSVLLKQKHQSLFTQKKVHLTTVWLDIYQGTCPTHSCPPVQSSPLLDSELSHPCAGSLTKHKQCGMNCMKFSWPFIQLKPTPNHP